MHQLDSKMLSEEMEPASRKHSFVQVEQLERQMDSLPLIQSGLSMEPDKMFGWKPKDKSDEDDPLVPIPLSYDQRDDYFDLDHKANKRKLPDVFKGL